jgi:ADP-heptose:LPS heptosyltransferase
MPALNFISPEQIEQKRFDAQIYFGSLGKLYRSNTESLAKIQSPYLLADTDRTAKLRANLKNSEKLVCGISWSSKNADHGEGKSLSLEALNPVLQLSGFDFVNLQYGDTSEERNAFVQQHGVNIHHVDEIDNHNDLDGLAALIGACDIVVTVSNTTAHLAAALGKPVIVMLPNNDALFWYWHRDSHTTPWYPSARLFRRSDTGRWEDVIDAVALTLAGIQ